MKLTLLGGGGFRVPLIHQAVGTADLRVDEIALYDTDPVRLAAIEAVLAGDDLPYQPRIVATTDPVAAITGADFIFCAIREGGLQGRVADERVALNLGVLGQETTGPGGLAYALRTIPVMRALAGLVREHAPNAWFINFTNPAGIVTEAIAPILGDRVVGICDTPIGLLRRVERISGTQVVAADYVGLNHLGWLRSAMTADGDVLPAILSSDADLARVEEARLMGFDWVRALGAIPNEYLFYYYYSREAVARILDGGETRGEFLRRQQSSFYDGVAADPERAMSLWHKAMFEREASYMAESRPVGQEADRELDDLGGGYHRLALDIMGALVGGAPIQSILNVRNDRGGELIIDQLPPEAVIEVPCVVDADGIRAHDVAPVTGHMLGLMQSVKAVEQLTIAAVDHGDAALAWKAFALHPLVGSVSIGRELLDGYRAVHPGLAYLR